MFTHAPDMKAVKKYGTLEVPSEPLESNSAAIPVANRTRPRAM